MNSAGTVMTPNYVRSLGISLSPWCDCSSSGNSKSDCEKFAEFFTNNRCLREWPGSSRRFEIWDDSGQVGCHVVMCGVSGQRVRRAPVDTDACAPGSAAASDENTLSLQVTPSRHSATARMSECGNRNPPSSQRCWFPVWPGGVKTEQATQWTHWGTSPNWTWTLTITSVGPYRWRSETISVSIWLLTPRIETISV